MQFRPYVPDKHEGRQPALTCPPHIDGQVRSGSGLWLELVQIKQIRQKQTLSLFVKMWSERMNPLSSPTQDW